MASTSTLSQTLQSITATKIEELEKQQESYEGSKASILEEANPEQGHDLRSRITSLHDGIKKLDLAPAADLEAIHRWVYQSRYDPSVPEATLAKFENELRSTLDVHSQKLSLADLYSRLLIEWIESPKTGDAKASSSASDVESDEDFDVVQDMQNERLQNLREKFRKAVFEPLETDEDEIQKYLISLFPEDECSDVLEQLKGHVSRTGKRLLEEKEPFDRKSLKMCIKSLLKNDLLEQERTASLTEFLRDDTVLDEIKDVLNMRYASLHRWSWNAGSKGIPVVPRQSLNGKWRVVMDEDVLQAIFTHWIGNKWVVEVKRRLQETMRVIHKRTERLDVPREAGLRREYFMDGLDEYGAKNLERHRQKIYEDRFFLAPMPSVEFQDAFDYDDASDKDDSSDDSSDDEDEAKLSSREIKQLLLRTLASEMLVRRSLDGEAAMIQSDFKWFATSISHDTIFAVLKFVGFQGEWIDFFRKVLEPPLNMLTGEPVQNRKRGLPMGHIFTKLFGELVLFFMDLAVSRHAGLLLYRMHDDLWLCGQPDKCAKAWTSMLHFAKVMGLEFNETKTGSAYIVDDGKPKNSQVLKALPKGLVKMDFLVLDPTSGDWGVDKDSVLRHVKQLRKQLGDAGSVLEWVKTWNSCIGRFFSYTFGEPANCFGRSHLNAILEVHKEIQELLFNGEDGWGKSVTEHLSRMISKRFNVHNVPDGFLYIPESLGGLGLRNPFVPLFLVSESLVDSPQDILKKYHNSEKALYLKAKHEFERLPEHEKKKRYREDLADVEAGVNLSWENVQEFFSFEEYMEQCEVTSRYLVDTYKSLVSKAETKEIPLAQHIADELRDDPASRRKASSMGRGRGRGRGGGRRLVESRRSLPVELDEEATWLVNFYAEELMEKCGSVRIVDKSFLPLGVLKAMRNRRVAWQMVL